MNYLFLSAIGEGYEEEEGTAGIRLDILNKVAQKLRVAILERDMIRNMLEGKADQVKAGGSAGVASGNIYNDGARKVGGSPSVSSGRIYNDDADKVNVLPPGGPTISNPPAKGSTWQAARPSALSTGQKPTTQRRVELAAQRRKLLEAKLREAKHRVNYERLRLERQGCVIRPDGTIDWSLSARTVEYDHDLARQGMTMLTIRSGVLYSGKDRFDTTSLVTQFSGPGYAIFVMSATGNIHVSSHSVGNRHHSSLLAGGSVAGAGELKCRNGLLMYLSNKSGHYQPDVRHLAQVLHQLIKNGVPPTFALKVFPEGRIYPSAKVYLSELAPEQDYDLAKLRRYHHFLKDEILSQHKPNPWRTYDPEKEKLGVYCAVTGRMVPHKEVRQWLKSQGMFANQVTKSGKGR
jgi:hypothetical protein